jgi:hypothetical protein
MNPKAMAAVRLSKTYPLFYRNMKFPPIHIKPDNLPSPEPVQSIPYLFNSSFHHYHSKFYIF